MDSYIDIKVDYNNSWNVFNNGIYATFVYIQQNMEWTNDGNTQKYCIIGDLMQFGKYTLKSDKLEYLRIKHE